MGCEMGTIVKRREIEVSLGVICVYIPLPVNHSPSFRPSPPSLRLNFTPWTVHRPGADRARHLYQRDRAPVCFRTHAYSALMYLPHIASFLSAPALRRVLCSSPMYVFVICHIAHTKPSRYRSPPDTKGQRIRTFTRVSSSLPPICTSALASPILVPSLRALVYHAQTSLRRLDEV